MPVVRIDGPRIKDLDTRRKLIGEITKTAAEVYGLEESKIIVLIRENAPECVGVGDDL